MAKLPSSKGRGGAAPLGEFLGRLVAPALAKQGLTETSLVTDWTEIAGAHIAKFCRPIEVQWPPRAARRNPDAPAGLATLVLRVESAFALEAQHSAAAVIERVNAHLGWRCIGKVAFRQGPLDNAPRRTPKPGPPSARATELAEKLTAPIAAEDLRGALTRLGARVIDKSGPREAASREENKDFKDSDRLDPAPRRENERGGQ